MPNYTHIFTEEDSEGNNPFHLGKGDKMEILVCDSGDLCNKALACDRSLCNFAIAKSAFGINAFLALCFFVFMITN